MPSLLKLCLFVFASLLLGLIFSANQSASAQTVIDTTANAITDSTMSLDPESYATAGQVITVPADNTALQSFTLYVQNVTPYVRFFHLYIYEWDAANERARGPEIFHSELLWVEPTEDWPRFRFKEIVADTRGVPLKPGVQYVVFISTSKVPPDLAGPSWGSSDLDIQITQFGTDLYPGGEPVSQENRNDTSLWTSDTWATTGFGAAHDLAFKATFISVEQAFQNLRSQLDTLNEQNISLRIDVAHLMGQVFNREEQISSLTAQNQTLTGQNQALQSQLSAANQTINDLNALVAQLQAQLNQQPSAISALLNSIEAEIRRTFNDPGFTIPGATPQQRLQNLINAIINLNKGRKEGLYQALGGKR